MENSPLLLKPWRSVAISCWNVESGELLNVTRLLSDFVHKSRLWWVYELYLGWQQRPLGHRLFLAIVLKIKCKLCFLSSFLKKIFLTPHRRRGFVAANSQISSWPSWHPFGHNIIASRGDGAWNPPLTTDNVFKETSKHVLLFSNGACVPVDGETILCIILVQNMVAM